MSNKCINGIKYSEDDYTKIATAMHCDLDWEAVVGSIYKPDAANALIEAIKAAVAVGKFDENWVPSEEIEKSSSEDPHPLFNGAEVDRDPDNISSYYTERKRGWSEERKMTNKFIDDVLSRVLYDKNSGGYQYNQEKNINKWLYEYKLELLRNLWSVTGIDHESEITPESFNRVVNQTIVEFGSVSNSELANQYYNDYIILKQFNNLLSKYTPFIKINAAYKNLDEHGVDMYYWDPSGKYRSNWTNTEDVDVEKVTSPVVKILLDYFPTVSVNGDPLPRKIGFKTFNTVMASILTWIHQNRTLNQHAKKISEDIRKEGLSYNFSKMIDVYMSQNPNMNEGMKDVLRGIKRYIFSETSAMPIQLRQAFANQFFTTAKYSYIAYRLEYDSKGHKFDVSGKYLEDGFVDVKRNDLMRFIKTRVRFLRNINANESENDLFKKLCESNHLKIEPNQSNGIDIIFDKEYYGANLILTVRSSGDNISVEDNGVIDDLDDSAVVDLIQKTFQTYIPDNYKDIIISMTANDVSSSNLFMLFRAPIAILYGAAYQTDEGIFEFDSETKELKTYLYKNRFIDAAHFQGIVSGVNELSVWKNGEGNNLPIFQLSPAIFDIFDIIDRFVGQEDASKMLSKMFYDELNAKLEDQTVKVIYAKNPYLVYPDILRRIIARSDAKVQGKVKTSAKMSVTEVASRAIFNDFYGNLIYENSGQNKRTTNDELLHCILMQPITFSDKTTHYLPATDLSKIYIKIKIGNSERNIDALTIFRELTKVGLDINTRKTYLDAIKKVISDYQYDKSKNIMFNQYLRFRNVFKDTFDERGAKVISDAPGLSIDRFNPELAFKEVVKVLNYINSDLTIKNKKDWIRRKFEQADTLFNEDYDVRFLKNGNLQANETLFYNLFTGNDASLFNKHLDRAIRHFVSNLSWYEIRMDLITDPQFRSYMDNLTAEQKQKWIDPIAGIMKPFITYKNIDGHKIPIEYNIAEIEDGALFDPDIEIELNPIFESYFYAHNMFSPAINDLLFADTGNYAPKNIIEVNFNSVDPFDQRIEEMMAGALSMEFKRTTYTGAVKRKFATVGVKFGVPEFIRFAGIDTSKRKISTIRGETHSQKTQDGNGWVDPILARMIQKSLVGSPVGDVRKTIAGWNDPTTGCQVNFKWAEDTITTYLRQRSEDVGSVEMMIRKGRRFDITDKFKKIKDFSIYYNPEKDAKKYSVADETITHTNYIYRKNIDTGTYWRLDSMKVKDGFLTGLWRRVDEHGIVFDNEPAKLSEPVEITNLYELDKAFGGAWVFDLINGNMVASEAVNDIIYHIVCTNGMENDFIGYFVGREACKSGAFNFNPYDRLSDNDEELSSYYLRGDSIGVLQNSDHDLDFSNVTEMSQMMLLLTQTGDNIDLVNQMYEDIGRVANEALQSIIINLDKEKEIYRILGKALMDNFDSRTKDELGIAQAFIKSAQATLDTNGDADGIILPYSAETIKGAFISTVTSMINKKGIRRKYAGFGGVEVGAEDTMVHYDVDGQHLTYEAVRDHYRPLCRKLKVTWQQLRDNAYINGKLNPTFVKVDKSEVEWGDTVFIRLAGDTTGGREIKIDTQYEFDLVTALLHPIKNTVVDSNEVGEISSVTTEFRDWEIYKWPTRSKQLGQSDLRWISGGKKISEYNLDSVRASFYLDELLSYKNGDETSPWGDEYDSNRKNVIKAAITNDDIPVQLRMAYEEETGQQFNIDLLWTTNRYDKLIPELKKLLNNKTSNYLSKLSRIAKSEVSGKLPTQMIEVSDFPEIAYVVDEDTNEAIGFRPVIGMSEISPNIEKRVAQIAMGRKNFDKFLLRKGDRLDKIKMAGPQFFYERLVERQTSYDKIRHEINNFPYDGLLNLENGETILVAVGNKSSSQLHSGQDFVRSTDAISYKGKVVVDNTLLKNVGDVSEIITNSIINESTGKIVPVLTVKDFNTLERLRKSSAVVHSSVRYTKGNWRDIIKTSGYAATINWNGVDFEISPDTVDAVNENQEFVINGNAEAYIIRQLNIRQRHLNRDRLKRKAELLYRNFIAQLNYIQTRIPSQAMQSTMALEVVDIVDTDTNYLWVPLITHLLQGSDLDIDKGYCMGYDIDESGNIFSESDLIYDPTYNVDDVLLLDTPTYTAAQMIAPNEELDSNSIRINQTVVDEILQRGIRNNWKKINYLRAFLKVIKPYAGRTVYLEMPISKADVNFADDPYSKALEIARRAIIDMNTHNMSVVDERKKAGALRNRVFAAARKIITDPASQMDHMLPVSLDEARSAASKSSLGQKEKSISIADPMTIYIMQQQNMSGKNVIALTATGIKSYFIITTHFNMIARRALNLINELITLPETSDRSKALVNEIAELFNQITFDSIFNPNGDSDYTLRTFANVNFKELRDVLSNEEVRTKLNNLHLTKEIEVLNANKLYADYVYNGIFKLSDLIEHLDEVSNGNVWTQKIDKDGVPIWEYFVVNAADSLGSLLNAATDNAKELVLEKLNASEKFADYYIALLAMGYKFEDIAEQMTTGAFRIVSKYAQDNIFDASTHKFNTEKAIDFVLNRKELPNIPKGMFNSYLVNCFDENMDGQVFNGFLKTVLDSNPTIGNEIKLTDLMVSKMSMPSDEDLQSYKLSINTNSDRIMAMAQSNNYEWKQKLLNLIYSLFEDDSTVVNDQFNLAQWMKIILMHNLTEAVQASQDSDRKANAQLQSSDSFSPEPDIDPSDLLDGIITDDMLDDITEEDETKWYFGREYGTSDLIKTYRYAKLYFLPKTDLWLALTPDDRSNGKNLLSEIKDKIIYATREIKMLGGIGSINQGMKVSDFDEYNVIEKINKFVNSAYYYRSNGEITEEFDLIKYLDEKDKDYHDRHIKYYDKVKATVNILRAIDYAANFKEMFKYMALNRKLIERSIAVKLERSLAKEALLVANDSGKEDKLNPGLTKSFGKDEFRTLSHYTRDLIILNFFLSSNKSLRFTIPSGEKYYEWKLGEYKLSRHLAANPKPMYLSTIDGLASFKHLMDWYVIPRLLEDKRPFIKDNKFIRNLIQDDIAVDTKSKQPITAYKLNMPIINLTDTSQMDDYADLLYDFNQLLYQPIGGDYGIGDWTIGDLFFIYNLTTYKDRIGGNSMTRLFEDAISSNNRKGLPLMYYRYISALDRRMNNIVNPDGSINHDKFAYDLDDLYYRLADLQSASWMFNISKNGDKISSKVYTPINNSGIVVISDPVLLSDFVFGMPKLMQIENFAIKERTENYTKDFNKKYHNITASSTEVINALIQELQNKYDDKVEIEALDANQIKDRFSEYSEDDISELLSSPGFIIDGKIYINTSNLSLEAPMHELIHFISAGLKFNKKTRNMYYEALQFIDKWWNTTDDIDLKEKLASRYKNRIASDKKEEILATLLSLAFKNKFNSSWGTRTVNSQLLQANIKQVLADILSSDRIKNENIEDISEEKLGSILTAFASQLIPMTSNQLSSSILLSKELAELKKLMYDEGYINLINCI